jgi:cytochrome P450
MTALLAAAAKSGQPLGRPIIDECFLRDPYPTYRALREAGPIHWSDEFFGGAWLVTRHGDVEALLRDARLSARRTGGWVMDGATEERAEFRSFQQLFARAMLFVDAPDHTRLRQVMNAGFRPAALQAAAPRIEAMVSELLDGIDATQEFDFVARFARPLPARVIATLMGVEANDQMEFVRWSDDLAAFIGAPRPSLELTRRAQASLLAMADYFKSLLPQRRRAPGDDLVSRLVLAEASGQIRTEAELLAQCAMLLFAGHETTRNLLGNGLHALLSHREQWDLVKHQPRLQPGAARELLRFESPVQYTGRRVAADLVLHGHTLRRGDLVVALIGAANRDPARYGDPDRLDVTRKPGSVLSFGHGPHVCIGAALTLLEAEIALRHVLRRWPGLELVDAAACWDRNAVYRGLTALQLVAR